jgi:hypothetical protein
MKKDYAGMSRMVAEATLELDAMCNYYESTGKSYFHLSPTEKRKVIEKFEEEHGISR